MSFDGIVTKGVVSELNKSILNGKINKVFEPNKNEVILGIYSKRHRIFS
jgi:predicted ribosome quality control (RQC) complex YloA/Tae2 family protein